MIEARLVHPDKLPKMNDVQNKLLEKYFQSNRNATEIDLIILSAEVDLSQQDVLVWYKNRLALWRKQQGLPANRGSVND
ncbi:homeodomain-only protein-like [Tubulanus polymorphus]|uniref:homeodomain-only protein-like n=1 Tax=Tubulanus polymorphus TaxID=672921 RepID=UPI003DA4DBA0